jgi:hypothetical protein
VERTEGARPYLPLSLGWFSFLKCSMIPKISRAL